MEEVITSTSQWTLVVHRVTNKSVKIWVGTLFPTLKMPNKARVILTFPDGSTRTRQITKSDWKRPFRKLNQRFYTIVEFKNLNHSSRYSVSFDRRVDKIKDAVPQRWQTVRTGKFDTLPNRIPLKGKKPFTIALGSCFYNHRDGGRAAAAYKALYERGADRFRPDISVLPGDQVYLDIGFDSLSLWPSEIRQRIANDYATHWQALGSILSRGGTWMLPDDHEYWNDYPFYDSLIPTLLALKLRWVRNAWTKASIDGVKNVQQSPDIETLSIGNDLSICFADLRSYRSKNQFLGTIRFNQLINWAESLNSPGVLVSPQPLIVEKNDSERNLLSFPKQYEKLLNALDHSGHDIVLLSGDVHFGRIATVQMRSNARLIEIIASPLSNLSGLNGIATAVPKAKPKKFPDPNTININDWTPVNVEYDKKFNVDTIKGRFGSAYPKDRTKEHFMTISFSRNQNNKIELAAQAWRIRERGGPKHLPVKDFEKEFKTVLN